MPQKTSRQQLQQAIKAMVAQSELFPESLAETQNLNDEELEKLTITLHIALENEAKLTDEEQEQLEKTLLAYNRGKQRVYQKAQQAWLKKQEDQHEHQECLFETALLDQLA